MIRMIDVSMYDLRQFSMNTHAPTSPFNLSKLYEAMLYCADVIVMQ